MKLYPNIPCELFVQQNGSSYQMVLRGDEEHINTVFNALYNFGATSAGTELKPVKLEFVNHTRTIATFWSNEDKMTNFFFWKFFFANADSFKGKKGGVFPAARAYADDMMTQLLTNHTQGYNPKAYHFNPDSYENGTIRAEKPDTDMRDAILSHAFTEKKESVKADIQD